MATTTESRPNTTPRQRATDTQAPPPQPAAAAAVPDAGSRRAGPTFDQFVLSQVPLALAVALIFALIAVAAIRTIPADGTGSGAAAPAGTARITAFTSELVAQQVAVAADPSGALKWDRATYEAQAGDVSFVVTNKSSSPHNFAVEGGNVMAQSKNFGANTTTTYTIKGLAPGEYLIVCNFPGHREGGMIAKLIVR